MDTINVFGKSHYEINVFYLKHVGHNWYMHTKNAKIPCGLCLRCSKWCKAFFRPNFKR